MCLLIFLKFKCNKCVVTNYANNTPELSLTVVTHDTCFRVLCGEWIEPLWDCMRATESPAAAILFFIPAVVIGNFVVSRMVIDTQ